MLHISIEPEYLDVNVHPTKMELRFQNGEMIFGLVRDAIAGALGKRELIPQVSLEGKQEKKTAAEGETGAKHYYEMTKELYEDASVQVGQSNEAWLDLSYINNCYLCE